MASGTINRSLDIVCNSGEVLSSITIAANSTYTNTAIDLSSLIPSGYTPIFATNRTTGSKYLTTYQVGIWSASAKTGVIQLYNHSSSALTTSVHFSVISVLY